MSKSIELLIKLHNPKCVSVETAGRGGVALLYKEQIICAFAQAENKYMLGYHLLMSKYRQEKSSREFVDSYVDAWCEEFGCPEHSKEALKYIVEH